jgi:hypothetical protein
MSVDGSNTERCALSALNHCVYQSLHRGHASRILPLRGKLLV